MTGSDRSSCDDVALFAGDGQRPLVPGHHEALPLAATGAQSRVPQRVAAQLHPTSAAREWRDSEWNELAHYCK